MGSLEPWREAESMAKDLLSSRREVGRPWALVITEGGAGCETHSRIIGKFPRGGRKGHQQKQGSLEAELI